MFLLDDRLVFPNVENADEEGLLAVGGNLSPERLVLAYRNGIFPWFNEDSPILWWSPDPRMVLFPKEVRISKSMRQLIKRNSFKITWNTNFIEVLQECSAIDRKGQNGTWITDGMKKAYIHLHEIGIAKSIEVWDEDVLVGGLYGVDLGHVFCGESMFSKASNASKYAFIHLAQELEAQGYKVIDCQVYNSHLESLGAKEIPRSEFIEILKATALPPNKELGQN
ncbi:Leucyl/phenylalanyl-tRNA--protein transferase [Arenibacter antarcticus]|uniref:Leucyl/phenylalanyl-tRNA--protein transferase n=1 Tax=Arenibacter antarcticus TaxID=2040469 RepID=A0ABW5VI89_9FLAO|nr:leucyl/phenylalanyl-tRNA--protein transferase [Arenibacter sp. H213]MCM4166814.1 leucyl/phenylalanyl-tRNA--protein transferase [Arenibacter sp. H213]